VVLGVANVNGGVATYTTSALLTGQHILTALYGGDENNQTAISSALMQTVQQPTLTVLISGTNPLLTAQAVTLTATVSNSGPNAATGTVIFYDGTSPLGSAALNASGLAVITVASMSAGQHSLTASYGGDTLDLASNSAVVLETVQLRPTSTSLASSATKVTTGQPLTLFSSVQGNGPVMPTGTVTFFSGSIQVGITALSATGIATLNYTPVAGTYNITANYTGDTVYAASASSPVGPIIVGQASQFTITPNPTTVSVASKQYGVISVTVVSLAGFSDSLELGCLGLPFSATCTFSNDQLTLAANGSQTVQLTLDTGAPLTEGGEARLRQNRASALTLTCGLPAGLLLGMLLWRGRRSRRYLGGLLLLMLSAMTIVLSGCGALQINGTPTGTYNIVITAEGSKSGITESANVTLTVTQ